MTFGQRRNTAAKYTKLFATALLGAMLAFNLAACGGPNAASSDQITSEDVAEAKKEIRQLEKEISDGEINILRGSKADIEAIAQDKARELFGDVDVKVSGDYDVNETGEYKLKIALAEKDGAEASRAFTLKVIDRNDMEGDYSFVTDTGFLAEVRSGIMSIDGLKIVNKTYTLPPEYGFGLTQTAYDAYTEMDEAAMADGLGFDIVSGYRSYYYQMSTHARYVERYGEDQADTFSAKAGHSEHQLGEAMDLNSLQQSFAGTPEGRWLNDHCAEYGFIIRYPKEKIDETGYMWEPWHIRYVGKELARKLYNGGDWITIEEYFGITSVDENAPERGDASGEDGFEDAEQSYYSEYEETYDGGYE